MVVYTKNLVRRYILGLSVEPYNIDELESSSSFMLKAMRMSKDKRLYNLCDDNLKIDSNFVLEVIDIFKEDVDFVREVLDYYFGNNKERGAIYFEILAKGARVTESVEYAYHLMSLYVEERNRANGLKRKAKSEEDLREIGLGFGVLEGVYEDCHELKRFIAERMMEDIFDEESMISFEELVHSKFKNVDDFKSYGFKTFMIDYIQTIDIYLADFLMTNSDLLDSYVNRCKEIIQRWNYYMDNLNNKRELIIKGEIERFAIDNKVTYLPLFKILNDILKELGLEKMDIENEDREYNPYDISVMRYKAWLRKLLKELYGEDIILKDNRMYLKLNKKGSNV